MTTLAPMDRYVLKAMAQRTHGYGHAEYVPPALVPRLVEAGYVIPPNEDAGLRRVRAGTLTDAGVAAAQPAPLTDRQLRRRGRGSRAALAEVRTWRRAIEIVKDRASRMALVREAGLWEECPVCLGLGVIVPAAAGVVHYQPTTWRLMPRVRPELGHYARGPGWLQLGWKACGCRFPLPASPAPPPHERDPRIDPRPMDEVDWRVVDNVADGRVGWHRPEGAFRYAEGVWDLKRWQKATKDKHICRWAEDWTVPRWLWPVQRPWAKRVSR